MSASDEQTDEHDDELIDAADGGAGKRRFLEEYVSDLRGQIDNARLRLEKAMYGSLESDPQSSEESNSSDKSDPDDFERFNDERTSDDSGNDNHGLKDSEYSDEESDSQSDLDDWLVD